MEGFGEIEIDTDQSGDYKIIGSKQLHCQDLMNVDEQIVHEEDIAHVNDYAILPAVNLCPITWGIGNLETVQTHFMTEECHVTNNSNATMNSRVRKKTRPYSPSESVSGRTRSIPAKPKNKPRVNCNSRNIIPNNIYIDKRTGSPFSCDKCQSQHIVNPARCSPGSRKRQPLPRKHIDPVNGRIMLLCNACGIAAKSPKKDKNAKSVSDAETLRRLKEQYLTESINFSKKLSDDCNEPEFKTIYCPSFRAKGCYCIQNYLFTNDDTKLEERNHKAFELLSYHRKARELSGKSGFTKSSVDDCNFHSENELHIDECEDHCMEGFQKPHYMCKSREFEQYVLTVRTKLRSAYGLCERATQRILLYSNNFLHKELKSDPHRGSRVEKTTRKISRLKPISELHREQCCGNRCARIAATHPVLLENWRKQAVGSQKAARKVIAEMLTPTGGTKANCYRFVHMVTGSCVATISSVNEHMRKTKGDREPAEHGLKKYWRKNLRKKTKKMSKNNSIDKTTVPVFSSIPSEQELLSMGREEAASFLLQKKQQLELLQSKLQRAESYLKSATVSVTTDSLEENLSEDFIQSGQNKMFILGQDGVIRPLKSGQQYMQIVTPVISHEDSMVEAATDADCGHHLQIETTIHPSDATLRHYSDSSTMIRGNENFE